MPGGSPPIDPDGIQKQALLLALEWGYHSNSNISVLAYVGDLKSYRALSQQIRQNRRDHRRDVARSRDQAQLIATGITVGEINAAKTHCPRGHEYTEDNIYRAPNTPKARHCRACRRETGRIRARARRMRALARLDALARSI